MARSFIYYTDKMLWFKIAQTEGGFREYNNHYVDCLSNWQNSLEVQWVGLQQFTEPVFDGSIANAAKG